MQRNVFFFGSPSSSSSRRTPPPWPLLGLSLFVLVGESVHAVHGGEDVVEVGEDIVGGECDELASTLVHLAEEVVGVDTSKTYL
jgi:hypothetical protein